MPRVIRLLRLLLYFSLWKQLSDFRRWEAAPMLALQDADMALNETRMLDVASAAMRGPRAPVKAPAAMAPADEWKGS